MTVGRVERLPVSAGFWKPAEETKSLCLSIYFISPLLWGLFNVPVRYYKIMLIQEERENLLRSCAGLVKQGKPSIHQSTALVNT